MRLFDKIKSKLGLNQNKDKYIKSFHVDICGTSEGIEVIATPVNDQTEYFIAFNSHDELSNLVTKHKRKIFVFQYADMESVEESEKGEVYLNITFNHDKAKEANSTPRITIRLNHEYKAEALDIYHQLNEQALMQEKGYNNTVGV